MIARADVVVLDIEGTTSAAGHIVGDLYAYARPRLGPWIDAHPDDPEIAVAVRQVIATAGLPATAGTAEVTAVLHGWLDADVKATPLKTVQGKIWAEGFARGEIHAHFFPDVPPVLRRWHADGLRLAVFSSGSVASQRPWFAHSPDGDLTGLLDAHFDTVNAGPKKEPASYTAIAAALAVDPARVLFLSDHPDELTAAATAGWQVVGLRRPGEPHQHADFGPHPVVTTFADLAVAR